MLFVLFFCFWLSGRGEGGCRGKFGLCFLQQNSHTRKAIRGHTIILIKNTISIEASLGDLLIWEVTQLPLVLTTKCRGGSEVEKRGIRLAEIHVLTSTARNAAKDHHTKGSWDFSFLLKFVGHKTYSNMWLKTTKLDRAQVWWGRVWEQGNCLGFFRLTPTPRIT